MSDGRDDGAISADGRIAGCYIHGFFHSTAQRAAWLARLGAASNGMDHDQTLDAALDELAQELETAIDCDALLALRSEERREGRGGVRTCRSGGWPMYTKKQKTN